MSNYLPQEKVEAIERAISAGKSIRQISREVGIATETCRSYRSLYVEHIGPLPLCECGQPSYHRGWCSLRYAKSPARQAVIAKLHGRETAVKTDAEGYQVLSDAIEALREKEAWIRSCIEGLEKVIPMLYPQQVAEKSNFEIYPNPKAKPEPAAPKRRGRRTNAEIAASKERLAAPLKLRMPHMETVSEPDVATDAKCGRSSCVHTKSQHTGPNGKCVGCWCYGFVAREQFAQGVKL